MRSTVGSLDCTPTAILAMKKGQKSITSHPLPGSGVSFSLTNRPSNFDMWPAWQLHMYGHAGLDVRFLPHGPPPSATGPAGSVPGCGARVHGPCTTTRRHHGLHPRPASSSSLPHTHPPGGSCSWLHFLLSTPSDSLSNPFPLMVVTSRHVMSRQQGKGVPAWIASRSARGPQGGPGGSGAGATNKGAHYEHPALGGPPDTRSYSIRCR